MSPLVIEGVNWGGQLMITSDVENYPGYTEGVLGPEMMQDFRTQAERFGAEFLTDEKLSGKMPMPDEFVYCITINSDEENEHQVLAGESSLPGDLQPLIEILERVSKTQMRRRAE
jgi:thioredoxin reductase